jgi:hypothetical protein
MGNRSRVVVSRDGHWLVAYGIDERRVLEEKMNRSRNPDERDAQVIGACTTWVSSS